MSVDIVTSSTSLPSDPIAILIQSTPSSTSITELSTSPSAILPLLSSSPSSSSDPTSSLPSTPTNVIPPFQSQVQHSSSSNVVPAYPYNVSMLPQTHNGQGITPDDSGISTRLPSICVDYLSHDWSEEDVWTSWKATTRHKSEIANGVRLENASWRTWAKQRGNLKTISPETLNWLKDSDVTWLYGPLHTAVEAVPPPRVATASERLGLDPLRSLSDSKRTQINNNKNNKNKKPMIITKPILKYRSLSDILLPPNTPASPVLEHSGIGFNEDDEDSSNHYSLIQHAKSDSNLVRMNANRSINKSSPLTSPRELSPDRSNAHASDSSTSSASNSRYNGDRRHISFNHRVEQCIAVDSTEEVKKYSNSNSISSGGRGNSDEEGDDEEDEEEEEVLTFKSSSRITSFGPSSSTFSSHPKHSSGREPHTIARLGPTTLKSTELYPHPSPAVVYQVEPQSNSTTTTYSTKPPSPPVIPNTSSQPSSPGIPAELGRRAMYAAYSASASSSASTSTGSSRSRNGNQIGWNAEDEEVEYGMGFDYFTGPDVGVGDEYDMAQYGSTHLVGGDHNGYSPGMGINNNYGIPTNYNVSSSSTGSINSSPDQSRRNSNSSSSNNSSSSTIGNSAGIKGPHSPSGNSKDSLQPKRSILKNHRSNSGSTSTSSSGASFDDSPITSVTSSPSSSNSSSNSARYNTSLSTSPTNSSNPSPINSPYSSATSLAAVMQSAGIPSVSSSSSLLRGIPSGVRRINSEEVVNREGGRGRSTSRGSSASLERSASADRRPSNSGNNGGVSVSPSSSYSPPSNLGQGVTIIGNGVNSSNSSSSSSISSSSGSNSSHGNSSGSNSGGTRPIGIVTRGRTSSSDSLSSLGQAGNLAGGREVMPDLLEASSESETETLRASEVDDDQEEAEVEEKVILSRSPGKSGIGGVLERNLIEIPSTSIKSNNSTTILPSIPSTPLPTSSLSTSNASPILIGPPLIPHIPIVTTTASSLLSNSLSQPSTHSHLPPRYRQPSPSAPTTSTSTSDNTITRVNSNGDSTATTSTTSTTNNNVSSASTTGNTNSLSNSPALDPIDLAGTPWSDENPVPSYARRSLLRASRGGSNSNASGNSGNNHIYKGGENGSQSSLDKSNGLGGNGGMRGSIGSLDSGIGSNHDDFGFGIGSSSSTSTGGAGGASGSSHYYDELENGETGLVGRTLEAAGDLLGVTIRGILSFGRKSSS